MLPSDPFRELVPVPRVAVSLPLPLPQPDGFDAARLETWPHVEGELEYVGGRLLYMPPSADFQQDTVADVVGVLKSWWHDHRDFVIATNEAGMHLGGETRAADAAVWRKSDLSGYVGGLRRAPPLLAIEVAGSYDTDDRLREKAAWYLAHGVLVVWLLFPVQRRAVVVTPTEEISLELGERIPVHSALPMLEPALAELFEQVSA